MTDAADLQIDTRNMAFVFLSNHRYNQDERPGERAERKSGGRKLEGELCEPPLQTISEIGMVGKAKVYKARITLFTTT